MVRPETNARATDVLGDVTMERIGNLGDDYLSEVLQKLNSSFGFPFEASPTDPISASISVKAGVYTLPDGRRVSAFRGGAIPSISDCLVDFDAGTLSTGTVPTFSIPDMTAGYFIRALVQYSFDKNAFAVTFGNESATLSGTTNPVVNSLYNPLAMVELQRNAGDTGFENIDRANIVLLINSMQYEKIPVTETVTIATDGETVVTLTQIEIPSARERLTIFKNGVLQIRGTHYSVDSNTQVTFTTPLLADAELFFRVD